MEANYRGQHTIYTNYLQQPQCVLASSNLTLKSFHTPKFYYVLYFGCAILFHSIRRISIQNLSLDIISISEAISFKTDILSINQFSGYNFIYDNLLGFIGMVNAVSYDKKDIDFTHHKDLEIPNQAIIWIEIHLQILGIY